MEKNFKLPETKDIENVEIFSAGTWNGDTFTEWDLDTMVKAFIDTQSFIPPYLKLGHDKGQKMVQKDGYPALGWVENLRRVGKKLVADFKSIPSKIYDLIEAQAYRKVSCEIFYNVEWENRQYPFVLKAVSLLGADTPAVQNLNDILSLYAANGGVKSFDEEKFQSKIYAFENKNEEDIKMETKVKELEAKLAESEKLFAAEQVKVVEFSAQVNSLKAENEELKKSAEKMGGEIKAFKDEQNKAKVEASVNKLIEDKKILPAQKEAAFSMLMDALTSEKKFSVEGKEVSEFENVLLFMNAGSAQVKTEPSSGAGERQNTTVDLDSKVKEFISEQKKLGKEVSYKEALIAVAPEEGIVAEPKVGE